MTAVAGGLSNRMWRLDTDRGPFAVKELNRDFDNPDYMSWFERAFAVELRAYEAGVAVPEPIASVEGRCLAELLDGENGIATVRVHRWVDAASIAADARDPELASGVGAMLAQVHALRMPSELRLADMLETHGIEHWRLLASRADGAQLGLAASLAQVLPVIGSLEAFVVDAGSDSAPLTMSHRDADQKNVLIAPGGRLVLVDWDAAGPVHPRHEIAKEALDWAGVHLGEPDPAAMRAFVRGYRDAGGDFDAPSAADFGEFVCVILAWCEYNVRRALGERLHQPSDRDLGDREAQQVLGNLPRFAASLDRWAGVLAG